MKILAGLAKRGFVAAGPRAIETQCRRGFTPDHPRAELLTYKGLTVGFPQVPKSMLTSPKLVKWLTDGCKASAPLVDWLAVATA